MDSEDQKPEKPNARDLALRRLAVREYAPAEMVTYLKRKGVAKDEAEETVAELVAQNLIDAGRYAAIVVRHQSGRGKGPMQILAALKQKGVSLPLAEVKKLYAEVSDKDELTIARHLVERRYPRALSGDPKEKRRAFQALMRRGFSAEIAGKCLKWQADQDD